MKNFAAQDMLITFVAYGAGYVFLAILLAYVIYKFTKTKDKAKARKRLTTAIMAIVALGLVAGAAHIL